MDLQEKATPTPQGKAKKKAAKKKERRRKRAASALDSTNAETCPISMDLQEKTTPTHEEEEKKKGSANTSSVLDSTNGETSPISVDMQEKTTPTHEGEEKKQGSAKKKKKGKKRTSSVLDSTNGETCPISVDLQEKTTPTHEGEEKKKGSAKKKKRGKKRTSSVLDSTNVSETVISEEVSEYKLDEPTMEEKLATLNLINRENGVGDTEKQSLSMAPPSADSVHILLKQALRADDNVALLTCLYNRDEKVIAKSISLLTPADVVKLLKFFVLQIQSRGAVLVCLLPWLQTLLSRHMSSIVSQEFSLSLLNSLYQLIDARTSTFKSALQLNTTLDYLFSEIADDDDEEVPPPIIYEDKDTDDEESEAAMETDREEAEELGDIIDASEDSDGSEIMSD